MATLTNVGVWGNGRALEYLLTNLMADPFAENRWLGRAGGGIGAGDWSVHQRVDDEKGKRQQEYLQGRRATQKNLAKKFLGEIRSAGDTVKPGDERQTSNVKVTLIRYDADAVDAVVGAILFRARPIGRKSGHGTCPRVIGRGKSRNRRSVCGNSGQPDGTNRDARLKHGRYEFDLLINIGEFRDLQRHRLLTPDRQPYTTAHGYDTSDQVRAVPEILGALQRRDGACGPIVS